MSTWAFEILLVVEVEEDAVADAADRDGGDEVSDQNRRQRALLLRLPQAADEATRRNR
ncbi:MAG: hypothetical protein U0599_09205 [Vicinamibacteria bacterium]